MTLSFRTRLTLRWMLAFGLVLALAHLAVYVGARAYLRRDLDAQLRTLAGTELASSSDGDGPHLHEFPADANGAAGGGRQVRAARRRSGPRAAAIAAAGRVAGAARRRRGCRGPSPREAPIVAGRGRRASGPHDGTGRARTAALSVVAVGLFTDALDATLARLARLLVGVWLGGLAVTAFVGFSLASRALAPIRRITDAGGGHRRRAVRDPARPAPGADDEIGRMTALLNRMLDRLHGALESNRRFAADASHELRGPLTAMHGEVDVTLKRARAPDGIPRGTGAGARAVVGHGHA